MLYLVAEDEYYYGEKGLKEIQSKYNVKEIFQYPDKDNIFSTISAQKRDPFCFLAPYFPASLDSRFKSNSFFEVIRLPNRYGILTTGQKKLNIPEAQVLEEKMGVKFHISKKTFKDYAGANQLLEMILLAEEKEKHGLKTKGFMIAGIPGTGKSHLAQCAAGETGRILVELNLSMFMEMEDGIYELSQFFDYFVRNEGRYILWIDEIEKMFIGDKAKQMLGFLLTKINDLGSYSSKSSFFFIATANNISGLAKTNPEFFRNGRFDALVFLLNPTQESAKDIFELYINKYKKTFKEETLPYMFKNASKGERAVEGTTSFKIFNLINKINEETKKKIAKQPVENFDKLLKEDEIKRLYDSILNNYAFTFDVMSFILFSIRLYGEHVSMPDRYVHTPAEIEYIIQDAYSAFYFSCDNASIEDLAQKYQPLQVTMKDAIQSMLGTADKFLKI